MPDTSTLLYTHPSATSLNTVIAAAGTDRSTAVLPAQHMRAIQQLSFPDERFYGAPGTLANSGIIVWCPADTQDSKREHKSPSTT